MRTGCTTRSMSAPCAAKSTMKKSLIKRIRSVNGGMLESERPEHTCNPPGSGWHGTFFYDNNGEADHIQPGDKWTCECGQVWIAGLDGWGYHKWFEIKRKRWWQ